MALILATLALLLPPVAIAQTQPLNDTGQTQCVNNVGAWPAACDAANTGDSVGVAYPGQDGRFGRDRAQAAGVLPAKTGGGAAGFDFTARDASGAVTTTLGSHDCVYDNVTGLLWSTEVLSMSWDGATAAYPSDGSGSYIRCNRTTGWRLPTRRELLSIVHNGDTWSPAVDKDYFPGYASWPSWNFGTADTYAPNPARAWVVDFGNGGPYVDNKTNTYSVRLVRSGQ